MKVILELIASIATLSALLMWLMTGTPLYGVLTLAGLVSMIVILD